MTRGWLLRSYFVLLAVLIAGSVPRSVGDGAEYLEMARQMSALEAPSVHVHFWLYSAFAAPLVGLAGLARLPAEYGFAALNLLLLVGAFRLVTARFSPSLAFVLFSGPIIWWVDKPHTEVLTFALLSVAVVSMDEAPEWSLVALGVAGAQNLAIAPLVPLAAAVAVWQRPPRLRAPRFWATAAASAALVAAPFVYYRLAADGVPILESTQRTVPNASEVGAVLFDLNLGLIPAFPILAILLGAGLAQLARQPLARRPTAELTFSGVGAIALLAAFSLTPNYNHGATFSMSRYALWLVPLSIPFLRALDAPPAATQRWPAAVAVVSCVWSAFAFHPSRAETFLEPTRLARLVWTRFPAWSHPLPEVFVERLRGTEREWLVPVATARCEKVLLTGRPDFSMWPLPCPPAPVPPWCMEPGRFCYANFNGRSYTFAAVRPPSLPSYRFDRSAAWTREVERVVSDQLWALRWWQLDPVEAGDGGGVLGTVEMRRLAAWQGDDRMFLYLEPREDEASVPMASTVTLRLPVRMSGRFLDAETGQSLVPVAIEPDQPTDLAVPSDHRSVILVLLAADRGTTEVP